MIGPFPRYLYSFLCALFMNRANISITLSFQSLKISSNFPEGPGPEIIKFVVCSTQLSMKCSLLISMTMPLINFFVSS